MRIILAALTLLIATTSFSSFALAQDECTIDPSACYAGDPPPPRQEPVGPYE